ncbi:hypothetical protein FQN54_005508 [Arachnomyces sp. PD_36]|nr:hypothetical protein FQN54_005508 [Arachnomyces sp. PD_36]
MANPFTRPWVLSPWVAGWSLLFTLLVSACIYERGFENKMCSPRKEHLVFRFSTCIQPQPEQDATGSENGNALDASQNLVNFIGGSKVVTVVDDGRFDWELIFAQNNFNSTGISWYASDFNRLHEAFDGSVGGDFEWNSIPFSCNDSRWSFDISNVQRAVLPPTHNTLKESGRQKISRGHPHPTIGCAYVYVLSREAWEHVAVPGLENIKRESHVRCWVRDLYNQRMPLDRSTITASIQLLASRFLIYNLRDLPTTMGTRRSPLKSLLTSWIEGHHPIPSPTPTPEDITVTVGESPEPVSTNLAANQVAPQGPDFEPEPKQCPPWVPRRQDSLVMDPTTLPWATKIDADLPSDQLIFSAYNGPDYNSEEASLAFPFHTLETVIEVDEDSDKQITLVDIASPSSDDQGVEPSNEPQSIRTSSNSTLPSAPAKDSRGSVIYLKIDPVSVRDNILELAMWALVLIAIEVLKQTTLDHHRIRDWCSGVLTWSLFAECLYWSAALFRLWWDPEFDIWYLLLLAFLQYRKRPVQVR